MARISMKTPPCRLPPAARRPLAVRHPPSADGSQATLTTTTQLPCRKGHALQVTNAALYAVWTHAALYAEGRCTRKERAALEAEGTRGVVRRTALYAQGMCGAGGRRDSCEHAALQVALNSRDMHTSCSSHQAASPPALPVMKKRSDSQIGRLQGLQHPVADFLELETVSAPFAAIGSATPARSAPRHSKACTNVHRRAAWPA